MSVSSKLFVPCDESQMLGLAEEVYLAIQEFCHKEVDLFLASESCPKDIKYRHQASRGGFAFSSPKVHGYGFSHMSILFNTQEERMLSVFFTCSWDYSGTYDGTKLIFSLNKWGKSEEIMEVVRNALLPYCDVYYDHNDSDDEDFVLFSSTK